MNDKIQNKLKSFLVFVVWISFVICSLSFVIPCSAKSLWSGSADRKVIALTFDDGPKPEFCQPLLDILDRYGAKATFFVVGKEAQENPDLIKRMVDSGDEVGNHTYSHIPIKEMTQGQALADIQKCSQVIYDITGKQPKYFRPPGGGFNSKMTKAIAKMGLQPVYWTLNTGDYSETTPGYEVPEDFQVMALALVKRVVDKVTPGSIILFHNGSEQTIRALPLILAQLKDEGYGFVTISDLTEVNI